ncbi:DUF3427 domain-containing protein [Allobaculum sp. Allo2]|uniref:DUF3427 domain-containing protein n=1 Tax=Allobaculum sp. Allo2 TaxID=2853432 RepID=UPI001F623CDB|nr:DUF3427 domain-containing protein [Allobaculum sp. Allo2]UNT92369.1 DUF3427 domain-containing protein [Allobaculum sp. Allo2]
MKWLLPQTRNDLRSKGIVFLERKPSISEEEILIRLVKAASLPLEARQALSRQIEHDFEIAPSFLQALTHPDFYDQLTDLMEFSLLRWKNKYSKTTDGTWFDLYQSYTYADVFRLLDLPVFENAQNVGGYKLFKEQNLLPVFINYQKAEDLAQSLQYEDHFESPSRLIAFSKNRRTLASPEIRSLQSEHPPMVLLFLRKSNDDTTKAFYFLGEMKPDGLFEQTTMANDASVVKIGYRLLTPCARICTITLSKADPLVNVFAYCLKSFFIPLKKDGIRFMPFPSFHLYCLSERYPVFMSKWNQSVRFVQCF